MREADLTMKEIAMDSSTIQTGTLSLSCFLASPMPIVDAQEDVAVEVASEEAEVCVMADASTRPRI